MIGQEFVYLLTLTLEKNIPLLVWHWPTARPFHDEASSQVHETDQHADGKWVQAMSKDPGSNEGNQVRPGFSTMYKENVPWNRT